MNIVDDNVCRTRPIRGASTIAALRAYRMRPQFKFEKGKAEDDEEALPPIDVFVVSFGLEPDPRVNERVQTLFAREAGRIMSTELSFVDDDDNNSSVYGDAAGYLYALHVLSDPANITKIGRTRRDPRKRRSEWELELAPQEGQSVILLCAYPTVANEFAERVIHEVLRCQHVTNRINPLTNDELVEFFVIENLMALKLFLRESLRFIDRYCLYWRGRRKLRDNQQRV